MIRTHAIRLFEGRTLIWGLLFAALVAASLLFARPAHADTFTVTTTSNSGAGSLRQAITDANNSRGADTIRFNIPGAGVKTISLLSDLPQITDQVTIDGYTQPGSRPNTRATGAIDAAILIELNGFLLESGQEGLIIDASNVVVRGLAINRFLANGINIVGGTGNRILGNSIFSNGGLGIDLDDDGPTANDPRDQDAGPNKLQNFPVITSAVLSDEDTNEIKGTLDSTPSTRKKKRAFTVQFFANLQNDDEGKTFLGQKRVTTNRRGKASFTFVTDRDAGG